MDLHLKMYYKRGVIWISSCDRNSCARMDSNPHPLLSERDATRYAMSAVHITERNIDEVLTP